MTRLDPTHHIAGDQPPHRGPITPVSRPGGVRGTLASIDLNRLAEQLARISAGEHARPVLGSARAHPSGPRAAKAKKRIKRGYLMFSPHGSPAERLGGYPALKTKKRIEKRDQEPWRMFSSHGSHNGKVGGSPGPKLGIRRVPPVLGSVNLGYDDFRIF